MKQQIVSWLIGAAILSPASGIGMAQQRATKNARIQRVEDGLLTSVVIKGQSTPLKLADRMAHYRVPGMSVAVINNGRLEWAKGYGVLQAGGTQPVMADTAFQAASISKPVVAMAALALVQAGALSLDEDVNVKLKSWHIPENEFTGDQKVTLRRLLNHSAGVTVSDVGSYATGEPLPTLVQALDGSAPAHSDPIRVDVVPGTKWRYSGGGYSVIQQLLIDVTGTPFPQLMQNRVLTKIGMTHSTFMQPLPREWEAVAAVGHDANGQPLRGRWHTFPQSAAAGLWTTASDLARFAIELQQSLQGRSNKVLSVDMSRQMTTKHLGDWGLGIQLGSDAQISRFSHTGQNEGFTCILVEYSDTGQGAAVMTNGDRGVGLLNELLRAIASEYRWPGYRPIEKAVADVDRVAYDAYVGEYEANGIRTTISTEEGRLYVSAPPLGPEPIRLYPSTDGHFFILDLNFDVTFVRNSHGDVSESRFTIEGQTVVATKLTLPK
jgi:CubicO group peptidase (beta-lactamase class C family)